MISNKQFWDGIAAKYATQDITDLESYQRKVDATRALFRPDMQVLEFGCGTGGTAIGHAPYVAQYRAIDTSEAMIAIARAKDGADKVRFEVAEIEDVTLDDGGLDLVLGLSILHLLPNPEPIIAKIYQGLKPGGYFISSTACLGPAWFLRPVVSIGQLFGKAPYLNWFKKDNLSAMLTHAGFEITEQWQAKGIGGVLFVVARKAG